MEEKKVFTEEKLAEMEDLVKNALQAPNKKAAMPYINQLESMGKDLAQYIGCVFWEMLIDVKHAAGCEQDKETKKSAALQSFYKFQIFAG